MVMANSLVLWREQDEGFLGDGKAMFVGLLCLFSNEGLVVGFLEMHSSDA